LISTKLLILFKIGNIIWIAGVFKIEDKLGKNFTSHDLLEGNIPLGLMLSPR